MDEEVLLLENNTYEDIKRILTDHASFPSIRLVH